MNVGLFVDTYNPRYYYKDTQRRIDYRKLRDLACKFGNLDISACYGQYSDDKMAKFIALLETQGYLVKFDKVNERTHRHNAYLIKMTVDIVASMPKLDSLILFAGNGILTPILQHARNHNKQVILIGYAVNRHLRMYCDEYINIESLELVDETTAIPE